MSSTLVRYYSRAGHFRESPDLCEIRKNFLLVKISYFTVVMTIQLLCELYKNTQEKIPSKHMRKPKTLWSYFHANISTLFIVSTSLADMSKGCTLVKVLPASLVVSIMPLGILESLDPGPGLWTRKCWTMDRDLCVFGPRFPEISAQSSAFPGPKSRPSDSKMPS